MTMADSIRFYRKKLGLRQLDLGQMLGISAQAVSKWELGKAEPDSEAIQKLCQIFGINSDKLLGIEASISFKEMAESLYQKDPNKNTVTISPDEQSLITYFRSLNKSGQEKLLDYARDLTESIRYTQDTPSQASSIS